jgi:PAS domain S-box-containing protein
MATYLDPIIWPEFWGDFKVYHKMQPLWLPEDVITPSDVPPSHFILADVEGSLREVYSPQGDPLPETLMLDTTLYLEASRQRAFLTTLRGQPFLLVSEPIEDGASHPMGSLVMLVPLDSRFLVASQQAVPDAQSIAAILDPESQRILSSSAPKLIGRNNSVDALRKDYVVTAQSFFDYSDSDLNMLYATLVPRDGFTATSDAILELERRQRAMGTAGIIAVFVLLFVLVSGRINRVMRRLQEFSAKALGQKEPIQSLPGNRLLLLDDRIREVIDLVLKVRDETRTRHESEIQQVESLRVAVMEASLDGIATIDKNGVVIDFNPTAQKLFGKSHQQALGEKLADLIFDADSAKKFGRLLYACLSKQLKQEEVFRHELTAMDNEGQELSVDVKIKPVLLNDELLYTVYIRDITGQRRIEDALRQRQNELVHVARLSTMGEMSTGIAHELNQPLSAIANYSNGCIRRLRTGNDDKSAILQALEQIASQATRAAAIIKRLRSLVTRQHMVRNVRNLNELVNEVCDLFAYDLRKHQVVLLKTLHPQPLLVKVDSVQIQQALLNLMRNAVDSMLDKPATDRRLVVACGERHGTAYITVTDTGSGISEKSMDHLFDPFYTTKVSGMGMGLAITQTIVDDHQGKIFAKSLGGKGSHFTIELPINIEAMEPLAS